MLCWPQTTPHADASDPRFVRHTRGSPRPDTGLVYAGACARMVPAIGLRCHRPQWNCNGIPVRLSACLHGGSRGPGGDAARRSAEPPSALAVFKLAHVAVDRELYQACEPSLATWEPVEVPRGPCPGPRRERRATCAEDDGATSVPLPTGRSFAFSVSPSPVWVWMSLPAALQPLPMLLPSGGTG